MLPAMVMTHKLTLMILGISTDFSTSIFRIFSYYFQESNSHPPSMACQNLHIPVFILLPYSLTIPHLYPLRACSKSARFFYFFFSNISLFKTKNEPAAFKNRLWLSIYDPNTKRSKFKVNIRLYP